MDSTFHALGQILLNGLPTFFLIIFLHFFLQRVFFKPLEATLARRYEATEGAKKAASQALSQAEARIAGYEAALRAARAEMYAEQEKLHKQMHDEQATALQNARLRAESYLRSSQADLERDAEAARQTLAADSDLIADQIANTLLRRKAA